MIGLLVIFLLSTITQQSNGLKKIETRFLKEPAYQNQRENNLAYNPNEYDSADDSTSWEDDEKDKEGFDDEEMEGSFNDEEMNKRYQDEDEEIYSRRLFEWFSRLFHTTTPLPTTVTTTESSYQRELKERIFLKALHHNLTQVLFKLSDVEKRVALAMQQKESYAIITQGKPQVIGMDKAFYYRDRLKRDVSNVIKAEKVTSSVTENSGNDTQISTDNISLNTTECPCNNVTSGRRVGSILATPTEVKNKLLLYIQESFQEIKNKIISLQNLKQAFSDNISFKIGYILANIDTLEISMLNLKNNMDKNKAFWEDSKILELYDTLKVSNQAVSGLMETLKVYLEKLSNQPQMKPEMSLV